MNNILDMTDKFLTRMIEIRRYLHENPELSFSENNTMDYICSILENIGVPYTANIAGTGVLATIIGQKRSNSPQTILLRADMDALPVNEISEKDYKSKNNGVMHACGHDVHTAILLGTCEILNSIKHLFSGTIKFAFQPGEETTGGAKPMIEEGILDKPSVDACFALHVDPDINTGCIRIKEGSLYGSPDDFKIIVKGRGGHGAEPHNCVDPINISAHIITALSELVSREISPFEKAVVSIGSIHSGSASNIIPDISEITGTARSLSNQTRNILKKRIGEIAYSICSAFNAECEYEYIELFPPLINDKAIANKLYSSAIDVLGKENCLWGGEATMAGEDFAYFTQKCPSVLFKLGCKNKNKGITYPLHHSSFDVDEECMKYGAATFISYVLEYMN